MARMQRSKMVKNRSLGEQWAEFRKLRGLTQQAFWSEVDVTQSGGCRYEQGRTIPKPVQFALWCRWSLNITKAGFNPLPPAPGKK